MDEQTWEQLPAEWMPKEPPTPQEQEPLPGEKPKRKRRKAAHASNLTEPTERPTNASATFGSDLSGEDEEFPEYDEPRPRRRSITKLQKRLTETYMTVGLMVSWVHAPDGMTIMEQSEARAREIATFAQNHPVFRDRLEALLDASDIGLLIGGQVTLATALLQNHGLVPQDIGKALLARVKQRAAKRSEPADTVPATPGALAEIRG